MSGMAIEVVMLHFQRTCLLDGRLATWLFMRSGYSAKIHRNQLGLLHIESQAGNNSLRELTKNHIPDSG